MAIYIVRESRQRKLNLIFALFIILTLIIVLNSMKLFSQSFHEVGLTDLSLTNTSVLHDTGGDIRIYQNSSNIIKFDIPEVASLKVGLYNKYDYVVRTYIYNNLKAGTYEIKIDSGNLAAGVYNCVVTSPNNTQSSLVSIK